MQVLVSVSQMCDGSWEFNDESMEGLGLHMWWPNSCCRESVDKGGCEGKEWKIAFWMIASINKPLYISLCHWYTEDK